MSAAKIKLGDQVVVISGNAKGQQGEVIAVDRKKNTVTVKGAKIVKVASKRSNQNQQGGIVEKEAPVHMSNVMVLSDGKPSRVGFRMEGIEKVRYAKATGKKLD